MYPFQGFPYQGYPYPGYYTNTAYGYGNPFYFPPNVQVCVFRNHLIFDILIEKNYSV